LVLSPAGSTTCVDIAGGRQGRCPLSEWLQGGKTAGRAGTGPGAGPRGGQGGPRAGMRAHPVPGSYGAPKRPGPTRRLTPARPDGSVLPMIGRIVIEDIRPQVDGGLFTSRAVAGETVPVEATIFRDGHNEIVDAAVRLRGPGDHGSV